MGYLQATPEDVRRMLGVIGVSSVEELFSSIPVSVRLKGRLDLPPAWSEMEILQRLGTLASENASSDRTVSFLGAGAYDHFIPAVVSELASRGEFYTSYTPYQAEASQGILQAFFEFQSMICDLTGMEVANASHYDGATALAEAVLMAAGVKGRSRVVVASSSHPDWLQVVTTYCRESEIELALVPSKEGTVDLTQLERAVTEETACVALSQPNFFGCLEELASAVEIAHRKGALAIVAADPISLGILRPPGAFGVDVVVGEAQSLGNEVAFGGPYVGFFATREEFVRRVPGRIVGQTVDLEGKRAFVLTLQTREQHIRRAKATSNICTNQGLCALRSAITLGALGKNGLRQVAELCVQKAHFLAGEIARIDGFRLAFEKPFFKEFVIECPMDPSELNRRLLEEGFLGGLDLGKYLRGPRAVFGGGPDAGKDGRPVRRSLGEGGNRMLVCVTEKRTKQEMERFVSALQRISRRSSR